jgi:hypothetical protein
MTAETLLSRLTKTKRRGRDSWLACCPAHDDKRASMTVRELPDGRVLVHCFAGCSVEEILGAVGLEFDALFPEKPIDHHVKPERRPFHAGDVLEAIRAELDIASLVMSDMAQGRAASTEDLERFRVASRRVNEARNLVYA